MPPAISSVENDHDIGVAIISFMSEWAVYITIVGLAIMIFALLMKFLWDFETDMITTHPIPIYHTDRLLPKDVNYAKYGTISEEDGDIEARQWNSSGSSDDLYDEKICVICFEGQRDCFFVPCGHCVSCYACGKRIVEGESKNCPICRRVASKVRRLFDL